MPAPLRPSSGLSPAFSLPRARSWGFGSHPGDLPRFSHGRASSSMSSTAPDSLSLWLSPRHRGELPGPFFKTDGGFTLAKARA